jgi:hypothetical protein
MAYLEAQEETSDHTSFLLPLLKSTRCGCS